MKNPSTLEEARAADETFLTLRVGKRQAQSIRAVHVAKEIFAAEEYSQEPYHLVNFPAEKNAYKLIFASEKYPQPLSNMKVPHLLGKPYSEVIAY